jgi:hypothetical protein
MVEHDDVDVEVAPQLKRLFAVGGLADDVEAVVLAVDQQLEEEPHVDLVVDDQGVASVLTHRSWSSCSDPYPARYPAKASAARRGI